MNDVALSKRMVEEIDYELGLQLVGDAKVKAADLIVQWLRHRESLGSTRIARFKRWWHGGFEYGHTGNPEYNTIYRRCVRGGVVEMRRPLGWIPIHKDHWHKFVAVEMK